MATKRFTDPWLRGLKPAPERTRAEWLDEGGTGLLVTVNAKRRITFWLIGRFPKPGGPAGNPARRVLGDYRPDDPKGRVFVVKNGVEALTLDGARQKAREWKASIATGIDPGAPVAAPPTLDTVAMVFDDFFKRHVEKDGQKDARGNPVSPLRSAGEIDRIFKHYVLDDPDGAARWRNRPIGEITRRDVTALLDDVQDRNGVVQADAVLAQLSKMFNWYALRGDDFVSPIVRGMRRSKPAERKRRRVLGDSKPLGDEEIRIFWQACEERGVFGALCRVALLTGQRREKITQMQWDDLSDDGLWTISAEDREKSNAEVLFLPPLVLKVIDALPRAGEFVFQGRLDGPINSFSKSKRSLDDAMAKLAGDIVIEPWVLHDLRRTAKTLMSRAGVSPHVGERVLGHVLGGVEGVYDRHAYLNEKRAALRDLANLVQRIIAPTPNVLALQKVVT